MPDLRLVELSEDTPPETGKLMKFSILKDDSKIHFVPISMSAYRQSEERNERKEWDAQLSEIAGISRAAVFPGLTWAWATYDTTAKPFFEKRVEIMKSKFEKIELWKI
jgi:hypothetical protein